MRRLLFLVLLTSCLHGCSSSSPNPADYLPDSGGQLGVPYYPNYAPMEPLLLFPTNNFHPRYDKDDY